MRLVYQIPLITTTLLILTIAVNVGGLSIFSDRGFSVYLSELEDERGTAPDPTLLKAFANIDKLDPDKQKEYSDIIGELSTISTALENISRNPNLYAGTGSSSIEKAGTGSATSIIGLPQVESPSSYLINFLTHPTSISSDSPEGRFIINILRNILFLNIAWLIVVVIGYLIWMRRIFTPIDLVTENIEKIIEKWEYSSTRYIRKDEFLPLIDTINSLQKTLAIQEKIRSNFLSDISHEIRTPITALQCYLEAIEDGVMRMDEKLTPLLGKELTRLTDITGQIMAYESLTHNTFQDIRVERFLVPPLIEDIITEYSPQLLKTNQKIVNAVPSHFNMSMDERMFTQILHNIFSNFIKYAGANTTLRISIDRASDYYLLTFADDGAWVPVEEIAFVKEKFYRVDKGRNQQENLGSMGIGLSIIETIARLHHGSCTIESGEKSGFTVRIKIKR